MSGLNNMLQTKKKVQSAYYGFMFSVAAAENHDVEVIAIHAVSEVNIGVEASIWSANECWQSCKTMEGSWKEVGKGLFSKVCTFQLDN